MEILAEIIRGIAVIIMLSLCLDLLLPKSELQPYIRTVTGLLLIIAVIYPLQNMNGSFGFDAIFAKAEYNTEQIISAGTELYESWQQEAHEAQLANLNSQIKSILSLDNDIIDLSVRSYYIDEYLHIELAVTSQNASAEKQQKWRETVNAYFGAAYENIKIEILPLQE